MAIALALLEVSHTDILFPQQHVIRLPDGLSPFIPAPLRTSIYVRPLYRALLQSALSARAMSATVITGNPGKTAFFVFNTSLGHVHCGQQALPMCQVSARVLSPLCSSAPWLGGAARSSMTSRVTCLTSWCS